MSAADAPIEISRLLRIGLIGPNPTRALGQAAGQEMVREGLNEILTDHSGHYDRVELVAGIDEPTQRHASNIAQANGWWMTCLVTSAQRNQNPEFNVDIRISHPGWTQSGDEVDRFVDESDVILILDDNPMAREVIARASKFNKRVYCDKM